MAGGWTNRGKRNALGVLFNTEGAPTNFYVALCTSAAVPTVDTETLSELTEIGTGTGYTAGGYTLTRNSTDFPTLGEDDTNNWGVIDIKTISWTGSGAGISGARCAVLIDNTDDVWFWWDFGSDKAVSADQDLQLTGIKLRIDEPA